MISCDGHPACWNRRLCSWECLFIFKQTVAFLTRALASLVLASDNLKDGIHTCLILIWFWLDDWISGRETASCSLCVPTTIGSGWVCSYGAWESSCSRTGRWPWSVHQWPAGDNDMSIVGLHMAMTCPSLACLFLRSASASGAWFCQSWQTCV